MEGSEGPSGGGEGIQAGMAPGVPCRDQGLGEDVPRFSVRSGLTVVLRNGVGLGQENIFQRPRAEGLQGACQGHADEEGASLGSGESEGLQGVYRGRAGEAEEWSTEDEDTDGEVRTTEELTRGTFLPSYFTR